MKSKYDIAKKIKELPEGKPFFTLKEVEELTGIEGQTIRKRIQDGTIKAKKVGGHWRIYPESLQKNSL